MQIEIPPRTAELVTAATAERFGPTVWEQTGNAMLHNQRRNLIGRIRETHFRLVPYGNGRNLNPRAADQTRNLNSSACWFGVRH